jgi:XTP/dITP diphosphohydrolase
MLTLVCATANPHKAKELEELLKALGSFILLPRPSEVGDIVEDGETFEDNAILKAQAICLATGQAAIADDSGLSVVALGGQPGVHSARYSGEGATDASNREKLLNQLSGVTDRRATFTAAIAVAFPDDVIIVAEGEVHGTITTSEAGTDGFGYDPLFIPHEGDGRSFGEMTSAEKHELSHRRRALESLVEAPRHAGRQ